MSAMAKMLADMVLKELPDEVRNALTPENLEKVVQGVAHKWTFIEGSLNAILAKQDDILRTLENVNNGYHRDTTITFVGSGPDDGNPSDCGN